MVEWLGVAAGTLTTLSFVPQVVRTWKSKSAGDVSLTMLLAFNGGIVMWLTYGILTEKPSIIFANGITLVLALTLLGMKLKFDS
ncbi:MAG: SemiSWEET transporter [Acidobacteriota bacterium]|nr:SemiSWEET transporter [Acidobacteriota bacterium]